MGVVKDMSPWFPQELRGDFVAGALTYLPTTADPTKRALVQVDDRFGNHLALVYNRRFIKEPPKTTDELIRDSVGTRRFALMILILFAVLALVLAVSGIYGVISYSVTQRTQEIGIRMALGAEAKDVLRLVLGQFMRLTFVGVVLGLVAAYALTRLMTSLLFGVTPTDVPTFVLVSVSLSLVALIACLIPARRATRVDPLVALRYE